VDATESEDFFRAGFTPVHSGLFAAFSDDGAAARFDHSGANEVIFGSERSILHPGDIVDEVAQNGFCLRDVASKGSLFSCLLDNAFDAIVSQKFFPIMSTAIVAHFVAFAPEGFDQGLEMFHGVEEVHDLDGVREVVVAEFFQAGSPVDEQDRFWHREQAASDGLAAQADAKVRRALEAREVGGGIVVAKRATLVILGVLGEDATEHGHAGFGFPVRGFPFAPGKFFCSHGNSRGIGADVEDFGIAGAGGRFSFLPSLRVLTDPTNHALDLAFGNADAANFPKMTGGLNEAGFIASLQANEPGQSGRVTTLKTKSGIGRKVPAFFFRVVVVLANEQGGAEHALHQQRLAPLGLLARFGDIGGINTIGRLLEEHAHQIVGWFEDGCAHEEFQLGNIASLRRLVVEGGDQFLDFGFLGEADVWVGRFFLPPARRSCRERVLTL